MLHDVVGENTIKERLHELKMLGASFSRSGAEKEEISAVGNTTVQLSVSVDGDTIVDVTQYVVLYAWKEYLGAHRRNDLHDCELRCYKSDESVHYFQDGNDKGTARHTQYWRAATQFKQIKDRAYAVTQQKVNFQDRSRRIEEVRRYPDGTEKLWRLYYETWRIEPLANRPA